MNLACFSAADHRATACLRGSCDLFLDCVDPSNASCLRDPCVGQMSDTSGNDPQAPLLGVSRNRKKVNIQFQKMCKRILCICSKRSSKKNKEATEAREKHSCKHYAFVCVFQCL